MSYPPPPPQGGYPYPPNPGPQGNIGFSPAPQHQQNQGPAYPMYPQSGGFPCPPNIPPAYANPSPGFPRSPVPYSVQPNSSAPYVPPQPHNPAPYSPMLTSSSSAAPYPPQYGGGSSAASPYPPQQSSGAFAPYPPQPVGNPAPYPPLAGANQNPYPLAPGAPLYPGMAQQNSPYSQNTSPYSSSLSQSCATPYQSYSTPHSTQAAHAIVSVGAMWPYTERATVRPAASFDPSTDAAALRKAMKGFGTDEATIIRILGRRTSVQRAQILLRYQQSFGKDLVKDLRGELSGDFEAIVVALMIPLPTYMAQELNRALMGLGTNERTLIEILCTNDNTTLRSVKAEYQKLYKKPIEADLRADTSGDFRRLMVSLSAAYRDETSSDPSLAPGLAQALYNAGTKKMGTNEAEFNRILSSYSYPLLRCVFEEYKKVSGGKTFESAIKSELSGDFKEGMLAIYDCINNRAGFFARYLKEAMRGFGTVDSALVRIVVTRSEIDMGNIKDEYRKKFGKRLEDSISTETSGDYKKMLLALIQD